MSMAQHILYEKQIFSILLHRGDETPCGVNHRLFKTHEAYTQTLGEGFGRADDRGCGVAFIAIALGLTPAINTGRLSPLNLSLHTMHIIPLSQNQPADTRKHLEIQTVHCVGVPRIPPALNAKWTRTLSILLPELLFQLVPLIKRF